MESNNEKRFDAVVEETSKRTYFSKTCLMNNGLTSVSASGTSGYPVYESFQYDAIGNVVSSTATVSGTPYSYSYSYGNDSRRLPKSVSLPDGLVANYSYDSSGRSVGRTFSALGETPIVDERIVFGKTGNTDVPVVSAHYRRRYVSGLLSSSNDTKYVYDKFGSLIEVLERGLLSIRYGYDNLKRLIREDNARLGKTFLFSYDDQGNITHKRVATFTLDAAESICSFESEKVYGYQDNRLVSYGNETISYDSAGRPTRYRGQSLSWHGEDLVGIGYESISYDGIGRRVAFSSAQYYYDTSERLIRIFNQGTTIDFIYDAFGVTGFKMNSITYLYVKNPLGDIVAIVNSGDGSLVAEYVYDAWGNHKIYDASGIEITDNTSPARRNPLRYRGYFYDRSSNLYYLRSRYYDPETGRFVSADHPSYLRADVPNGLNPYTYCRNNPIRYSDNSGHFAVLFALLSTLISVIVPIAIGESVLGLIAYGINAIIRDKYDSIEIDKGGMKIKNGFLLPGFFSKMVFLLLARSDKRYLDKGLSNDRTLLGQTIEWWGHNVVSYFVLTLNSISRNTDIDSWTWRIFLDHTKDVDLEDSRDWWRFWEHFI